VSDPQSRIKAPRQRVKKRWYVITIVALLVLFGGLAAFNYVLKPMFIAGFVAKLQAQPPVPVTTVLAKADTWRVGQRDFGSV
jgi:hypothetical protein